METDVITPEIKEKECRGPLDRIRDDFLGLNTIYRIANGEETRRIYLDSTASTLMMGIAHRTSEKFLKHYSNTHSLLHFIQCPSLKRHLHSLLIVIAAKQWSQHKSSMPLSA